MEKIRRPKYTVYVVCVMHAQLNYPVKVAEFKTLPKAAKFVDQEFNKYKEKTTDLHYYINRLIYVENTIHSKIVGHQYIRKNEKD